MHSSPCGIFRSARTVARPVRIRINAFSLILAPLVLVSIFAQAQTYDSELRLGIDAYKNSRYDEAIQHFRKATELDPTQTNAHLYLATTYSSEYIPGVPTSDNVHCAEQAIEQYKIVLDSDAPGKKDSAKGIAYLYLNLRKWDESKTYYQKANALDPDDPEPYYSIGVIDWSTSYQPRMEERARLGIKPGDNLDPADPAQRKLCDELRAKNRPAIADGIDNLNKAIQLRPDYADAMAYLNLMYRERADVECDDLAARQDDFRTADHWVDEVMRVRKAQAEKSKFAPPPPPPPPEIRH